jgi:hypothetical protein
MAGTEELKRMAEYLRDQMSGCGIPAEVQEFDALVGFTGTAGLMVLEPEKRVIQCPPSCTSPTPRPGAFRESWSLWDRGPPRSIGVKR